MRRSLRRWVGLGITAIALVLVIYLLSRSPEWSRFRWDRFWATLEQARLSLLILGAAASLLTFLIRAYRWKFFLEPLKKGSLWGLFVGQILGFTSIYLIGRAGELVRPAYIARRENVTFMSQLAVLLLERIYDVIFLVLVYAVATIHLPVVTATHRGKLFLDRMRWGGAVAFFLSVAAVVAVVLYCRNAPRVTRLILRAFRFLPVRALAYLERLLRSFSEGLSVLQDWKDLLESTAATVLLWLVNISVFWVVFRSLGGDLERLPWQAAALAVFCGGLGLVLQLPGIGGGYQVGVFVALTRVFGVHHEAALGGALLAWFLISVPCIMLGLVLLALEGLSLVKLSALAGNEMDSEHEMSILRPRGR